MFIDEATITAVAGKGGAGAVAFSKVKMTLGPTGGSGGNGGDVYLEAVADLGALRKYRATKTFMAEAGRDGRPAFRDGHDGEDLVLPVPRGTVARIEETGEQHELTRIGERVLVAKGGKGGKGNFQYKSSTNTSPKQFQPGLPGERAMVRLELKLIADIGLVGLPNVGKSSFLNAVTNAQSRVANYPFTTLEPHLGTYYELILADIPGLIAGASSGKGLGIKFLRHVERTRTLFHFIDATSADPLADYTIIRNELRLYDPALLEKPEYIFVSKTDLVDEERVAEVVTLLASQNTHTLPLSIESEAGMAEAKKLLTQLLKEV